MILKICGITNQEDAAAAIAGGANALGFNFYPRSPRYIAPERAAEIAPAPGVRRVGVFVNAQRARVEEIARIAALDVAQLHGEETPADYQGLWRSGKPRASEQGSTSRSGAIARPRLCCWTGQRPARPSTGAWPPRPPGASSWRAGWMLPTSRGPSRWPIRGASTPAPASRALSARKITAR